MAMTIVPPGDIANLDPRLEDCLQRRRAHLPHQDRQLLCSSHRIGHQDDEHEASGCRPCLRLFRSQGGYSDLRCCDAFAFGQEDTNNDRITIEWTNTPDGAAKQFRREWFQGDGMVLPIEYNP